MAPKRLGKTDLQQILRHRNDAVTEEPLHPQKHISITSPDGSLTLYYNLSTLVRIAETKGQLMQPPHFREPMEANLVSELERLNGGPIQIHHRAAQPQAVPLGFAELAELGVPSAAAIGMPAEDEVRHGRVANEVFEHWEYLAKGNFYVCPTCYEFTRKQHFPGHSHRGGVADPLDVLERLDQDTELCYVVFATASRWKAHVKTHHGEPPDCADWTFRSMIQGMLAKYNQRSFQKERFHKAFQTPTSYWNFDARYNVMRYNRMLNRVKEFESAAQTGELDLKNGKAFDVPVMYEDEQPRRGSGGGGDDDSNASSGSDDEEDEGDEEEEESVALDSEEEDRLIAAKFERRYGRKKNYGEDDTSAASSTSNNDDDDEEEDENDEDENPKRKLKAQQPRTARSESSNSSSPSEKPLKKRIKKEINPPRLVANASARRKRTSSEEATTSAASTSETSSENDTETTSTARTVSTSSSSGSGSGQSETSTSDSGTSASGEKEKKKKKHGGKHRKHKGGAEKIVFEKEPKSIVTRMNPAELQQYDRMLRVDRKRWNDEFMAGGGRLRVPERFVPFPTNVKSVPIPPGSSSMGVGQTPNRPTLNSGSVQNTGSGQKTNTSVPTSQIAAQNSGEKIRGKGSPDKPFQVVESGDEGVNSSDDESSGVLPVTETDGTLRTYNGDDDDEEEPVELAAGLLAEEMTLPTQTQRPQPQQQATPGRASGNRVVAVSRLSGPTTLTGGTALASGRPGGKQTSPEDDRLLLPAAVSERKSATTKPKPTLMLDDDE